MLHARARLARDWLFDAALPAWSKLGLDQSHGCFYERVGLDGAPIIGACRVRVQARQTAVFAIAGKLGWGGPWREVVAFGLETLTQRCLRADGGAHHTLDAKGAPLDQRRDLYDLAFIIFAFAKAASVADGARDLILAAEQQIEWLEAHWAHPAGGFTEGEVAPIPPRRQNPHMHLFEAFLALHEASGAPEHLARAQRLFSLAVEHLYDPDHGVLREFFDDQWRPAPGETGQIYEPGHLFEWSWLIDQYARLTATPLHPAAARLHAHAEAHGVAHDTGAIFAERLIGGGVHDPVSRLWTHTERIKANVAAWERTQAPKAAEAAAEAFDTLMRYCDTPTPGLWRDRMDAGGVLIDEPAPASSFYHIIVALAELIRVTQKAAAA